MPPPAPDPDSGHTACPLVMVNPEIVTSMPEVISNTRLAALPFIASKLAPGPVIVRFLLISRFAACERDRLSIERRVKVNRVPARRGRDGLAQASRVVVGGVGDGDGRCRSLEAERSRYES